MHTATFVSRALATAQPCLKFTKNTLKDTFGRKIGSIFFQVIQATPFIYTGVKFSGVVDQFYIDAALGIFILLKIIKDQSPIEPLTDRLIGKKTDSLIDPKIDRLICNLIAARMLFPYILEGKFPEIISIDTIPYTEQCSSIYAAFLHNTSSIGEVALTQCQKYFDIFNKALNAGALATVTGISSWIGQKISK